MRAIVSTPRGPAVGRLRAGRGRRASPGSRAGLTQANARLLAACPRRCDSASSTCTHAADRNPPPPSSPVSHDCLERGGACLSSPNGQVSSSILGRCAAPTASHSVGHRAASPVLRPRRDSRSAGGVPGQSGSGLARTRQSGVVASVHAYSYSGLHAHTACCAPQQPRRQAT